MDGPPPKAMFPVEDAILRQGVNPGFLSMENSKKTDRGKKKKGKTCGAIVDAPLFPTLFFV